MFCLGRVTFCQPVWYTQPKISVTYLIFTAELTLGLACSDSIYIVLIFLLLVHTAIKDLDLDLESCRFSGLEANGLGLDLDSVVAGLDTSLARRAEVRGPRCRERGWVLGEGQPVPSPPARGYGGAL